MKSARCDGVTKHCWKAGGHGPVGLYEAIVNSCNVFFYNVGRKLDIDKIAQYAMQMGLGQQTGIDLFGEDTGLIPSREWKARAYKTRSKAEQAWYPTETLDVSIGQGAVAVTPLQAAWAMGGLASGGRLVQPHLVDPEIPQRRWTSWLQSFRFDEYHDQRLNGRYREPRNVGRRQRRRNRNPRRCSGL